MATGTTPKYADGTDTGWVDTEITLGNGTLYYRRVGDICELCGDGIRLLNDLPTGSNVDIGTLPANAKPREKRAFIPANALAGYGFIIINTSGLMTLYNRSGNTYIGGTSGTRLFVSAMYF